MKTFITQRWHGHIAWRTLFWRDLLLIGTGLNLLIVSAIWRAPQRPALVLGVSVFWLLLFMAV